MPPAPTPAPLIEWADFEKLDIRVGTIREVNVAAKLRKPAYQLVIDFGELGLLRTSAQITALYEPVQLTGRQVVAVVNFPPKQIGHFFSECLVLGVYTDKNEVVLLGPGQEVKNGAKIA
jgi:tRNA-binding protein